MAIKGKKKSGSRGSQARRRPAAAPRPVTATTRHKTPWYNTATGRVIAALLVVLILAGIGGLIAVNRSNANREKERLEAVEAYAEEVRSGVQSAATPVGELSAITPTATPEQLGSLKEDAEGWTTDIEAAASRTVAIVPPEQVSAIHPLFSQAYQLYLTSARLLLDAADAEGKDQADLLTRSTEVRGHAESVWATATAQVDDVLTELGGDPSGLQSPGITGASAAVPAPGQGGGGGGGQGGGGDGG